jgi:hypothetical protein
MTPQITKPQTKEINSFQPVGFYLILALIAAFIGSQIYFLVLTVFAA